jgi:hypothetical protein
MRPLKSQESKLKIVRVNSLIRISIILSAIFSITNPAAKVNGKIDRMVAYNQVTNTCIEAAKKAFFGLPKTKCHTVSSPINIKREVWEALSNSKRPSYRKYDAYEPNSIIELNCSRRRGRIQIENCIDTT